MEQLEVLGETATCLVTFPASKFNESVRKFVSESNCGEENVKNSEVILLFDE